MELSVNESKSLDSLLIRVAQMQKASNESQEKAVEEGLKSSDLETKQWAIAQKPSKAVDEDCKCGHARRSHLWGSGGCLYCIPIGGGNPGYSHCRCVSFGVGILSASNENVISTMPDKRDNRDPLSEEMNEFTRHELFCLREERAAFPNGKPV